MLHLYMFHHVSFRIMIHVSTYMFHPVKWFIFFILVKLSCFFVYRETGCASGFTGRTEYDQDNGVRTQKLSPVVSGAFGCVKSWNLISFAQQDNGYKI